MSKRPSSVSGTVPPAYQCGARAVATTASHSGRRASRGSGSDVKSLRSEENMAIRLGAFRRSEKGPRSRSEEHTSELQSLMRISYAVFCLKKKIKIMINHITTHQ